MLQRIHKTLLLERSWFPRAIKVIWTLLLCLVVGLPLYVYAVRIDLFGLFGRMPSLKAIENPENDLSSELISADGVSLGRYFYYNRSQVTYKQLSPDLVKILLYSEDHRFYDHSGLDFQAYLRVLYGIVTFNASGKGGGSTLTQQLAKNLYTLNPELDGSLANLGELPKRIIQKTKEWIISVHLERNFTKEEIMTMYLNTSAFGSNAYGVKVASETYFKKQPLTLNLQESAVLVGMLQNPSLYHPRWRPKNALKKRNDVLLKAYKHGHIKSQSAYDSLVMTPIQLKYSVQNQNAGFATYFRATIERELTKWCKQHGYNLYESGLKIYTTIDSRMQRYAVEAVEESMSAQQKIFDSHWKNRNPWIDEGGSEIEGFLESRIKQTEVYRYLVKKYEKHSDSVDIMLNIKKPMTVFTWKGDRDTLFSFIDSLNYYKRFLQAGFMSMDSQTGAVKAWVGGINHKYFKYDHVRQGSRQPAQRSNLLFMERRSKRDTVLVINFRTSLRPLIYRVGAPGRRLMREEIAVQGKFNAEESVSTIKNSITAQVLKLMGAENVVAFARRAGIKSHS